MINERLLKKDRLVGDVIMAVMGRGRAGNRSKREKKAVKQN
jgi:hypothetical protein